MHFLLLLFLASGADTNYCEMCHSDVKVEYQSSVHAREEMTCVSCHGGNPQADTEERAHGGTFRSFKERKRIPDECGTCHSDTSKMKPYGLPTDQLVLYQISAHGKRLRNGDTNVAMCTDCHGAHKTLPPSDPESMTHPRNIPQTCGICHADKKMMSVYKLSSSIISEYESSIHGKALREGNHQAPVCTSCHGTHGMAPPGVGDVSIVCGNCHQAERNHYRNSPHQIGMTESGIPECAGCHNYHKVEEIGPTQWVATCSKCHPSKDERISRGEKIQTLITQAQSEITKADQIIQDAMKIPLDVSDYQAGLEEARTYMVQVAPVSHSLRIQEVEDLTRSARSIAVEIQSEIIAKQEIFRTRRLVLILVWFYIILTIVIIYRYRKILESGT